MHAAVRVETRGTILLQLLFSKKRKVALARFPRAIPKRLFRAQLTKARLLWLSAPYSATLTRAGFGDRHSEIATARIDSCSACIAESGQRAPASKLGQRSRQLTRSASR